ncbi:hypothetical protein CTAYLR_008224 [Chrysophaeum taylorii]|uniref:Uncharacterized protein n=1 Tax=Chrysophaeum taylorii TaxID=2483200 RepID=A0AAD7UKV0_9STRA|nr:hypothetical protein CTAYLR_008224 [Chrysophaeum taylorii]
MADDDFHHTPPPSGGGDDDRDGGSTPSYRGGGGGGGDDDASSSRGRDDVRRPRFFYDAAVDVGDGAVVRSDVIDVILLTDRIAVLSAVLASVCVNTNAALRFHLVVPDSGLAEARVKLMPSQCAGADWRLLAESAVVQSIRDSGLTVTWEVEVPSTNLSVRAPAWDRSPKHNTVFNCLRFYLPRLPEFAELESIIFMDDDVIMQGDIARLWELPLSEPLSAGCINWIWNSCGRMEASSNLSYVEVPYMGFGALPRGGDGSVVDLTCADADERGCAPSGLFASLSNASAEIQGTRLDLDALRAKRAWNFGLNKFNLTAWRVANITERYIAWIAANREFGWFPTTSLAYGLGIPYLTLADDVACMDDVGMPVLHGLGFVEPDDLKLSDIPLESISSFYALHWNGDRKPYAWRGAIPEYKEHFLAYAPAIKKTETDEAQRELASIGSKSRSFVVWTAPHSGSEWFMSVLDEHENVCASGGGAGGTGRGWPRDSLLPIHDLSEEDDMRVCQPKTLCHWAKVSRLLATLLDDDDGSGVPSVCDATFDARVMKYDDFYGIHLETLCAILERAAAAVEGNTVDLGRGGGGTRSESWITRVMQESFRVFVAENLRPPTLALSSQNATDKIGRALARGGNSLQMPCACPSSTTISGTKVMNDWLNNEAVSDGISRAKKIYNFYNLAGVLEELGSKIIVLDRENLLETYVSLRVAEPTSPHEGRLSIDVNRLLRFVRQQLRQREERDDRLAEKRFKVLHVQYESCIANKRACFQEVLGFLEVESNARVLDELGAASFDSTSRDTRTVVSLEQRILNFNAVAEALVVNGFERYLTNEDLNLVSNYTPTFGGGAAAKNSSRLASIEDDVHVLIMSDRAPALAATLSSTCATTSSIANLVIHLVLPNHSEDPTWRIEDVVDECWGARFEIRSIASIEDELLNRHGVRPVWTSWSNAEWHQVVAPKYARDRSSKHMSPFNLARFYVPLLREYEGVRRLLLLDDDVIVQRDIAFAHDVSFGEDAVVLAGCQNWISSPHEGFFRMTPNHLLRVFETPHFGFRRIRPGGALSDALCDDDAHYDCMPSTFLASLSDAWRDVRCQVPTECPEDDEAIVRGLAAQPAWNFGLVSVDVHAWRRKNLTRVYHAWTNVAEMRGLFPAGSLAHGLGLAYLALEDEVECWESLDAYERHVRIGVLQGLGYIMPQDLAAANLSTHEAYALHFNGEVKPTGTDTCPDTSADARVDASFFDGHADACRAHGRTSVDANRIPCACYLADARRGTNDGDAWADARADVRINTWLDDAYAATGWDDTNASSSTRTATRANDGCNGTPACDGTNASANIHAATRSDDFCNNTIGRDDAHTSTDVRAATRHDSVSDHAAGHRADHTLSDTSTDHRADSVSNRAAGTSPNRVPDSCAGANRISDHAARADCVFNCGTRADSVINHAPGDRPDRLSDTCTDSSADDGCRFDGAASSSTVYRADSVSDRAAGTSPNRVPDSCAGANRISDHTARADCVFNCGTRADSVINHAPGDRPDRLSNTCADSSADCSHNNADGCRFDGDASTSTNSFADSVSDHAAGASANRISDNGARANSIPAHATGI